MIPDKVDKLLHEVSDLSIRNTEEVEWLRLRYLSKKGEINTLMTNFRNVAADEKKTVGMKISKLKQMALDKINALKGEVQTTAGTSDDTNLTRTPYPIHSGIRHLLIIMKSQICDIFQRVGSALTDGPEIDDDLHIFTKLSFVSDHPVRDMRDTFFVSKHPSDVTRNILLRSHTSGGQSHYTETRQPPIRIIRPGGVYRDKAISARVYCFFHQVGGLYTGKDVSFTDLKQVLLIFAREMFGPDTDIRLRLSYFPFVKPNAEMDISCSICGGDGCAFCKHTDWVEIFGCGTADPNVLESCGIDGKVYNDYAFGMSVECTTNLKYRVNNLYMFSEDDLRFLKKSEAAYQ